MKRRAFGLTADGRAVDAVLIAWPGGLEVEVLTFGAIVRSLKAPTADGPLRAVLAYETLEDYERDTAYIGALVGRVANRIADGRFRLDDEKVQLSVNEPPNTLHGGKVGFSKRVWRVEGGDERSVRLAYTSPDGEEGFPGEAEVGVAFSLVAPDTLEIAYDATTDRPTAINLSHHLYFNLSGVGGGSILDHRATLAADAYTPVGPGMIPTGEVRPVEGGPFDLRRGATIGEVLEARDAQLELADGLDLNFVLSPSAALPALSLEGPGGARLELTTDQPGLQVYSGQHLEAPFARHGGLAIEPQGFPDAPNHPNFPPVLLRPGETYRRRSRYRLSG